VRQVPQKGSALVTATALSTDETVMARRQRRWEQESLHQLSPSSWRQLDET
jgi:hypothetical protein